MSLDALLHVETYNFFYLFFASGRLVIKQATFEEKHYQSLTSLNAPKNKPKFSCCTWSNSPELNLLICFNVKNTRSRNLTKQQHRNNCWKKSTTKTVLFIKKVAKRRDQIQPLHIKKLLPTFSLWKIISLFFVLLCILYRMYLWIVCHSNIFLREKLNHDTKTGKMKRSWKVKKEEWIWWDRFMCRTFAGGKRYKEYWWRKQRLRIEADLSTKCPWWIQVKCPDPLLNNTKQCYIFVVIKFLLVYFSSTNAIKFKMFSKQ